MTSPWLHTVPTPVGVAQRARWGSRTGGSSAALALGLWLALGSAPVRAEMTFSVPPGFALAGNQSDGLSVAEYNPNGVYTGDNRGFILEPPNENTVETTVTKNAPMSVTSDYFPGLAGGGTAVLQVLLTDPPVNGAVKNSDQIVVTVTRPQGQNFVAASFELRSDPTRFFPNLPTLGTVQETGAPQDITDLIFSPGNNANTQVSAFRVWVISDVEPVPEPSTLMLSGLGVVGLLIHARRRNSGGRPGSSRRAPQP